MFWNFPNFDIKCLGIGTQEGLPSSPCLFISEMTYLPTPCSVWGGRGGPPCCPRAWHQTPRTRAPSWSLQAPPGHSRSLRPSEDCDQDWRRGRPRSRSQSRSQARSVLREAAPCRHRDSAPHTELIERRQMSSTSPAIATRGLDGAASGPLWLVHCPPPSRCRLPLVERPLCGSWGKAVRYQSLVVICHAFCQAKFYIKRQHQILLGLIHSYLSEI